MEACLAPRKRVRSALAPGCGTEGSGTCRRAGTTAEDGRLTLRGCENAEAQAARGCQEAGALVPPPLWILLFTSLALVSTAVNESYWSSGAQRPRPALVASQHCVALPYMQKASILKRPGEDDSHPQRKGRRRPEARGEFFLWRTDTQVFPSRLKSTSSSNT